MERGITAIKESILRHSGGAMIVAATKMVDVERINRLKDFGIFDIGENRTNELLSKFDKIEGMRWHFIGSLQSNKVKYIIDKVVLIHSVDSRSLADEISKRALKCGKIMDILVEVNIGREPAKSGIFIEELDSFIEYILSLKGVRLRGLMSVLPIAASESLYEKMHQAFLALQKTYGTSTSQNAASASLVSAFKTATEPLGEGNSPSIDYLSMGMSDDYEIALKHGANIIRPGSAIFGKRNYLAK